MITRPTTLILGAGASAPFGFPTGYQLLNEVLSCAAHSYDGASPLLALDYEAGQIQAFWDALRASGKSSVDSFLEHRPTLVDIGKAAMAWALIRCESEQELFKRDGTNWYEYLFNRLNSRFEDFDKNKLSVLTFNYDRSLEHFLFTALKNAYGKSDEECAEKLKAIPILHLHGDLGELPFMRSRYPRHYDCNTSKDCIRIAASRIKIIHEGLVEDPQFTRAHKILSDSHVICFLGFGYHGLNMERLLFNMSGLIQAYRNKVIIGSSFGLTGAEIGPIARYEVSLRPGSHDYRQLDVLSYLRETGVLNYD